MALTVRTQKSTVFGSTRVLFADVTFDSAYATGGESLTSRELGFSDALTPYFVAAAPARGLVFEYDHTNKKLKAHYPTGGAAAPAALAAPAARTTVPAGATTMTAATAAPTITTALTGGQAIEVAAATDLSAVVTRVFAVVA